MCDLVDCVLCGERQKEKTFVIKKEIDGFPCEIKLELSRQICEGCFIEGTVRGIVNNKSLKLDLKPYQERFIKEWWEKSDLNQEDFMEMYEAFLFLEKKGIMSSTRKDNSTIRNRMKDWIDIKNPSLRVRIEAPSLVKNQILPQVISKNLVYKKKFQEFVEDGWLERVDGNLHGCRYYKGKHWLSEEKIKELYLNRFVNFNSNGDPMFMSNEIKRLKICTMCGELLPFSRFTKNRKGLKSHYMWQCRCCVNKTKNEEYEKLSEEEKEKKRQYARDYNKTEKGKASRKKHESSPARRRMRNARKQTNELFKKLEKSGKNQDHKTLNTYYKGNGCLGKFWLDWWDKQKEFFGLKELEYGVGKNGDHSDGLHQDHVFPLSKFWDYYPLFMKIVDQCDLPEQPTRYRHLEKKELIQQGHFLNLRPLAGKENIYRGNNLLCEEINEHYANIAIIFPELFPNGYKPIRQEEWNAFEEDLNKLRPKEKESNQLELDFV